MTRAVLLGPLDAWALEPGSKTTHGEAMTLDQLTFDPAGTT